MKQQEVMQKIDEMMPDIVEFIKQKAQKAVTCGALDLDSFDNDYRLPKIVLAAVAKELSYAYRPFNSEDKKEVANLENYL